jgi:lipoate-protein ligase B
MPVFERVAFAPNYLGYLEGFELQKKVHAEVVAGKRAATVLLLEHQSVYTAGEPNSVNYRVMALNLWKQTAVERLPGMDQAS